MIDSGTGLSGVTIGRRALLGGTLAGAAASAAGCSFQDTSGESGAARLRMSMAAVTTIDPHIVGAAINLVTAGLMDSLVLQNDEATEAIPGLAESWDVDDDELVFTFHLREAKWSNGDPVVADDVVWSFQRLMTPTGATANAARGSSSYQSGLGIKGANDFATGALGDWEQVGVKALDEKTVEITLEERNPDFLISMTHYSMVVLHRATVEAKPDVWMQPEYFVGSSAMVPKTWVPNSTLLLVKNDEHWDAGNVHLDEIDMRLGGDTATNTLAFKSGELDFVRVSGDMVRKDAELQQYLQTVDGYAMAYLQTMWGGHPAIKDARVRQALSLATDREALAKLDGVSRAGTSLIPDSVPGWSDEVAVPYDVDKARKLLDEHGQGVKKARLQTPSEVPWHAVLKEQWRENLGLDLAIDVMEPGLFSSTRLEPYDDTGTLSLYYGTYGGVPTFNTWVFINFDPNRTRQMSLSVEDWKEYQKIQEDKDLDGPAKAVKLEKILATKSSDKAQEFTRLASEARNALDPEARVKGFLDAELVRQEIAQSIPVLWSPMIAVVSDRVDGLTLRSSPECFYFKGITVTDEA